MFNGLHAKIPNRFEPLLAKNGVHPKSIEMCSEIIYVAFFAAENKGVGIGVEFLDSNLRELTKEIVSIPIEGLGNWTIGLSVRSGYRLSDDERIVADFLLRTAEARCSQFGIVPPSEPTFESDREH
jgi:hypothetical protein